MSFGDWLRRWRHRRSWRKADSNLAGPLREFVYLDEVSVYSLVASQVGLIVTELSETQATSLQSEVSGGAGAATPFARAEVNSRVQAAETRGSQVLRKAIVQTTFKQLRDTTSKSGTLRLQATQVPPDPPKIRTVGDIEAAASDDPASPWILRPERLRRGDLIEMEVQLEAEPVFQAGAVTNELLEIVQDDPASFGMSDRLELGQVRLVSKILERMRAGLVPLRGTALNYRSVPINGEDWLVHDRVTEQLDTIVDGTRSVFLVGVAQEAHFWKDVRRVVFSDSIYRVMARLNEDGLQSTWTPVKSVDVLRNVIPDFADTIDYLNRGALTSMSSAAAAERDASTRQARELITAYASILADRAGVEVSERYLEDAGLLDLDESSPDLTVTGVREILAPVTESVQIRTGHTFEREVAADCRIAAMTRVGLLDGAPPAATVEAPPPEDERFLDSEIVAVYW